MSNCTNQEKELLIDSMVKLIDHIYQNKNAKEEIFNSFSNEDLNKLMENMEDDNGILRKISALFLCELLCQSSSTQLKFCEIAQVMPVKGRVCVNKVPDSILTVLVKQPSLLEQLHQKDNQPQALCWFYSQMNASHNIQHVNYFYRSKNKDILTIAEEFLDPKYNMIGFSILSDFLSKNCTSFIAIEHEITHKVNSFNNQDKINYNNLQEEINQNDMDRYNINNIGNIIPNSIKIDNTHVTPATKKIDLQVKGSNYSNSYQLPQRKFSSPLRIQNKNPNQFLQARRSLEINSINPIQCNSLLINPKNNNNLNNSQIHNQQQQNQYEYCYSARDQSLQNMSFQYQKLNNQRRQNDYRVTSTHISIDKEIKDQSITNINTNPLTSNNNANIKHDKYNNKSITINIDNANQIQNVLTLQNPGSLQIITNSKNQQKHKTLPNENNIVNTEEEIDLIYRNQINVKPKYIQHSLISPQKSYKLANVQLDISSNDIKNKSDIEQNIIRNQQQILQQQQNSIHKEPQNGKYHQRADTIAYPQQQMIQQGYKQSLLTTPRIFQNKENSSYGLQRKSYDTSNYILNNSNRRKQSVENIKTVESFHQQSQKNNFQVQQPQISEQSQQQTSQIHNGHQQSSDMSYKLQYNNKQQQNYYNYQKQKSQNQQSQQQQQQKHSYKVY